MPAPTRPTLDAIAREASVSLSTVSKVLNGRPGVSAATRRRVEELLHDSGYARRGVDAERGETVELVIENLASEWSVAVIRGVERVTRQNGLALTLSTIGDYHAVGDELITGVLRRKPVAIVLQFSNLTADHRRQLRTRNIPFVVVDPAGDPPPDVPAIGGPADLLCSRARLAGYESALQEAGVCIPGRARAAGFSREDGEREGRRLLTETDRPTAIVCGNDMQALGVCDAAFALGLDVPRDLSVVGFDDAPSASWARPPLTTVRQPLQEMAEEATRLALRLRAGEVENSRLELATTLVERGSTAPPPA